MEDKMIEIERILDLAMERNSSDIHLISSIKPMLRIARDLLPIEDMEVITPDDMWQVYDFFVRGNIEKDELFKKERKLDTSYEYKDIRLRVNVSLSDDVPVCTLRLIKNNLPRFEELGVPDIVRRMTYQPQGLILVTGKTNSGKTTTLNALINEINEKQNRKILTLENPVEYKHSCKRSVIVQKEVGVGKDSLTFSDGVKNSLREDCDILVIGEIRDRETMEAAIEMETRISAEIARLASLKIDASKRIGRLKKPKERLVLQYRYLNGLSWKDIMVKMDRTESSVHTIHRNALEHFTPPKE